MKNGSEQYVIAITKALESEGVTIHTGASVTSITRKEGAVQVTVNGATEQFDKVVIATHADSALAILEDASKREQEVLGGFSYSDNKVILHSWDGFMPKRASAWASWNYSTVVDTDPDDVSLTYYMNSLQNIPDKYPLFVTLNPKVEIPDELVHEMYTYSHPLFDMRARQSQERRSEIQGVQHTYFAGAHWGYGFHESGLASAVDAVQSMGFPIRLIPSYD